MLPSQITSTPENNGQDVNPSMRSETNPPAVHVGHSELLKQWVIESVSSQARNYKPECQPKTYSPVVVSLVVWDAMVDIQQALGDSSRTLVLSLVPSSETTNGADPTHSPLVTITPPDNTNPVEHLNPHPNVSRPVTLNQEKNTTQINSSLKTHSLLPTMKPKSKLKSWPTDLLRLHSLFMKILFHINLVFTNTSLVVNSEAMPLRWSDGVLRTELSIGPSSTHGTKIGVTKVPSKS